MSITYIAGRQLKIGNEIVEPGEEVDGSIFPRIEALLNSGRLYAVASPKDVEKLPRHLYTKVITRQRAKEKIEGDPSHLQELGTPSREAFEQSDEYRQAEAEAVIRREGPGAFEKAQALRLGRKLTAKEKKELPEEEEVVPEAEAPEQEAAPGAEPEFDPSEHTVEEVQEHLSAHPEDSDRVLEAERNGKNRKTLVE